MRWWVDVKMIRVCLCVCAVFEETHKPALASCCLFPSVAAALLAFPHNEALATHTLITFYYTVDDLVTAAGKGTLAPDTLPQVA